LLGAGYSAAELLQATAETLPGTTNPVFTTFMDAPKLGDFDAAQISNSQTMDLMEKAHVPGFAARDMLDLALRVDLFRELFSFNECGGFYTGDAFLAWFRSKLQAKGLDPDLTWSQFAPQTGSDVSVVTSDVTEPEMLVLNERTAPQVPVALAVRMSMSIPFVWREMIWDTAWGTYRGRNKVDHIFVDGGVLSNFPLELVAESNPEIIEIMGNTDPNGAGTLGLMLDQSIAVPGAQNSQTPRPRLRTADRVTRLIDTMTGTSDAEIMRKYPKLICHLPVGGYGTTEFRMSQDRMNRLIDAGRNAMTAYLSQMGLS
jgi:predicted acylesterase/phospholipase RssA